MGKKGFFNKGQDVRHFHLMSRSVHDPNADDPEATPMVLEAFVPPNKAKKPGMAEHLMEIPESLQKEGAAVFGRGQAKEDGIDSDDLDGHEEEEDLEDIEVDSQADREAIERRLEALDGDCYFPQDGYNYEKHIRSTSKAGDVKGGKNKALGVQVFDEAFDMSSAPTLQEAAEMKKIGAVPLAQFKADEAAKASVPATSSDKKTQEELEMEEAMAALDDPDIYEELDEGLIDDLLPSGVVAENELLWGKSDEDLPDLEAFKAAHRAAMGLDDAELAQMFAASRTAAQEAGREIPADEDLDEVMDEYGDEELGEVEGEEIEGEMEVKDIEDALDEYLEDQQTEQKYMKSMVNPREGLYDKCERVLDHTKAFIEQYEQQEEKDDDDSTEVSDGEDRKWDCETILTTHSNLSNRPGKIGMIKVLKKAPKTVATIKEGDEGEPEEAFRVSGAIGSKWGVFNGKYVLPNDAEDNIYHNKKSGCVMRHTDGTWCLFRDDKEGAKTTYSCDGESDRPPKGTWTNLQEEGLVVTVVRLGEDDDDDIIELPDVVLTREKDESKEDKKARKQGVKEMRKICRQMKKESKDTFKQEIVKLNGPASLDVRGKVRYNKI